MKRILISDHAHPILQKTLEDNGYQITNIPKLPYEELPAHLPDFHGIIINSKMKMNKAMLDLGTNLEFIGRLGSGLDIIDLEYAAKKGIKVISTPEGNRNAVAEHALGMLLCLSNNFLNADQQVRNLIWEREKNRGFEIKNKVVGLVGFGNTGQSFGEKLSPWVQRVLYFDKYLLQTPKTQGNIERVSLESLQKEADIISLHLPLTSETKHMVNEKFIANCKKGCILINTSRGSIIDTRELLKALKSGMIKGVCLDVFENEKPETYSEEEKTLYSKLFSFENAVFTPHIAGWTHQSLEKIAQIMANKIINR